MQFQWDLINQIGSTVRGDRDRCCRLDVLDSFASKALRGLPIWPG